MLGHLVFALTALVQGQPAPDARQVLTSASAKQAQRLSAVDNYTIIQTVNGSAVPLYFEKVTVDGRVTFRSVPISEWNRIDTTVDNKAIMAGMATGARMLADGFRIEGSQAGPGSMFTEIAASMLDSMALFADFAAVAEDSITDGRAEAAEALNGMGLFTARARFVREEVQYGRPAYLLRATSLSDIPMAQTAGGPKFTLESVSLWLDTAELVPVRLLITGNMTADRKTIPVTIEQQSLDYRQFGPLYEPQRQVMRITGLMEAMTTDPRQRRDLERLRGEAARMTAQMEKMEADLARLPESQRRMIEGRMTQALAQIEQMTRNGTLEMEVTRTVHAWNKGPPVSWSPQTPP